MARTLALALLLALAAPAAAATPAGEAAKLRAALATHPDDARGWFRLGVLEARRGRYAEAIDAFRKAARGMPDRPEPLVNLAVIYNELGDARAAAEALEAALALRPKDPFIHENLGEVHLKLAIESFAQAGRLRPNPRVKALLAALVRARRQHPAPARPVQAAPPPSPAAPKAEGDAAQAPAGGARPPTAQAPRKETPAAPDWKREVSDAIERWRTAWSARDLAGYFAMYAPDFHPARLPSHEAWRRYKTRVILGKRFIRVRLSRLELARLPDGRVRARFVQDYRADDYHDRVQKELVWERKDGHWRIVAERVR